MKAAASSVGELSVRREYLEVAHTLNREIEGDSGLLEVTLQLQDFRGGGAGAEPNLESGGDSLLGVGGARCDRVLVEEILKLDSAFAETGSVGVGEIVGNIVQIGLLCSHSTGGGIERSKH